MIRSPEIHLSFFNKCIVSLIEFEKLLSLLASTYVYLTIQVTLQYCAKVAKSVFHIL